MAWRTIHCIDSDPLDSAVHAPQIHRVDIHLVDGTYELFRHYHAIPSAKDADGREVAAVRGVLRSLLGMMSGGATHVGVATDHIIESFRNDLWPGYKTGDGIEPDLLSQFPLLEEALTAVNSLRGRLGALQRTTLETNIASLNDTVANLSAAESSIRDADFAAESAKLTRAQILVQAGTAVLQIANQNPQQVLALLRS